MYTERYQRIRIPESFWKASACLSMKQKSMFGQAAAARE